MFKISKNAEGMFRSKYRAILRKTFLKNAMAWTATGVMLFNIALPASAMILVNGGTIGTDNSVYNISIVRPDRV